jgi:hypothetical protein
MCEMLVVIGERPTTRQRLVGYRLEYILQPGEVTSHADNRLHDYDALATGVVIGRIFKANNSSSDPRRNQTPS